MNIRKTVIFTFLSIFIFNLLAVEYKQLSNLEFSLAQLFHKNPKPTKKMVPKKSEKKIVPKVEPIDSIGKQILQYSNQFRLENKLKKLEWNQKIADLAKEHSKNMALKKVKFGHDGFNDRIKRFPFPYKGAAENVFMGISDNIAKKAVDSWKNSPGHRKNLLGNYNYCGIEAYQDSKGYWYITQIFALF